MEIRRASDNFWHVARDEQGVYIRIGFEGTPATIPSHVAAALAEALTEVLDD